MSAENKNFDYPAQDTRNRDQTGELSSFLLVALCCENCDARRAVFAPSASNG